MERERDIEKWKERVCVCKFRTRESTGRPVGARAK